MGRGHGGHGKGHCPTPNDNRSMSKNPQTSAGKAALDNRANQLNPDNRAYQGPKP